MAPGRFPMAPGRFLARVKSLVNPQFRIEIEALAVT